MLINNTLNDNVLESMLVTLDRTHILALTYLIHENIYKKEDVKRYLENRTYYPRETELLNAISNAVSDNEDINLFAGLSTALSKLKRPDTDIDVNKLAKKIKDAKIQVNFATVGETSDRNKNPTYTLPEFELIRGQYNNLFKYVNRPMTVKKLADELAKDETINGRAAKKYKKSYQRLYAALANAWDSYPSGSKFNNFYKTNQYREGSTLNSIPIQDNDRYSGLLNVALFELYKYTQNPSDDNSAYFGMLDPIIDAISNALSEAGIKLRDKRYNILDRMIQQNIGCSLNYSIGIEKTSIYPYDSAYRYGVLSIPKRSAYSSILYYANMASLFAIMYGSNDTKSLPDDVKTAIQSTNCDYITLSNFDDEDKQRIVANALIEKRVAASEIVNMPVSLYPTAVSSSLLSLMKLFIVNGEDSRTNGYRNNQLLKSERIDSRIKYVVNMQEEDILTFLENDYTIEDESTDKGYHEISSPGRCNIIGVINKIIKNFIDPKNFSITMATIGASDGIEMIKDKISKIKADIYQNFTLDPFTRSELPLVAMAYEIIINYLNYLVVGNTVYNTADIDVFSNAILKNYSFNPNNTPETETDFRILVSNHIYKPYKYLYFMRHILMNVPVLEDYMNSDSKVLEEYRGFLTGSAFNNIVYNLKTKYNETRDEKYWQKIYDMSVTGKLE